MAESKEIISIVGPESTGKSTLALELADVFSTCAVPEFARGYLDERHGRYEQKDLLIIAEHQAALEERMMRIGGRSVFCDTDLLVISIWHQYRYGKKNPEIENLLLAQPPRKYLLLYPDLPWEPDPLRENPENLEELFDLYRETLEMQHAEYRVIKGTNGQRTLNAIQAVNELLGR